MPELTDEIKQDIVDQVAANVQQYGDWFYDYIGEKFDLPLGEGPSKTMTNEFDQFMAYASETIRRVLP